MRSRLTLQPSDVTSVPNAPAFLGSPAMTCCSQHQSAAELELSLELFAAARVRAVSVPADELSVHCLTKLPGQTRDSYFTHTCRTPRAPVSAGHDVKKTGQRDDGCSESEKWKPLTGRGLPSPVGRSSRTRLAFQPRFGASNPVAKIAIRGPSRSTLPR